MTFDFGKDSGEMAQIGFQFGTERGADSESKVQKIVCTVAAEQIRPGSVKFNNRALMQTCKQVETHSVSQGLYKNSSCSCIWFAEADSQQGQAMRSGHARKKQ